MEKILPWLRLKSVPGVGNLLYKRLLDQFGSPELALNASEIELCRIPGITERIARAILSRTATDADRYEIDLAREKGFGVVTLTDPAYPALLREIPDPPPFLYVCGNLENTYPCVAVVGSRHATDYGLTAARRLGSDLAFSGITIVSGMARGIDTAAHLGALDANGNTIAVLGSGLSRVYPSENMELFQQISRNGAVVSEFSLNAGPDSHHFPIRNRVISGMSLGTVIVEGSMNSGSLITARLAVEQGREVFAVPGSIQSYKSAGTHYLIKQGAKLVQHAGDIIEELEPLLGCPSSIQSRDGISPACLSPEENALMEAVGPYPVHIDELARKLSLAPGKLSSLLLQLELKGSIRQLPGNFFTRSS